MRQGFLNALQPSSSRQSFRRPSVGIAIKVGFHFKAVREGGIGLRDEVNTIVLHFSRKPDPQLDLKSLGKWEFPPIGQKLGVHESIGQSRQIQAFRRPCQMDITKRHIGLRCVKIEQPRWFLIPVHERLVGYRDGPDCSGHRIGCMVLRVDG